MSTLRRVLALSLLTAGWSCRSFGAPTGQADPVLSQSVRAYGLVLRLPADARRDTTVDVRSSFHGRVITWSGERVAVSITVCTVSSGPDGCTLGDRLPGVERDSWAKSGVRFRSFERLDDGRPVCVAWVSGRSPDARSVIVATGASARDSSLVRQVIRSLTLDPR